MSASMAGLGRMAGAAILSLCGWAGGAGAQTTASPMPPAAAPAAAAAPTPAAPASAPALDRAEALQRVADSPLGACLRRAPRYPQDARQRGDEGRSVVAFTVDAQGMPGRPELAGGSGSEILDQAALAHLQQCIGFFQARLARDRQQAAAPAPAASRVLIRPPAPAVALPPGTYRLPIVWRLAE